MQIEMYLFLEADAPTPPQRFLARDREKQQNAIVAHLRGALYHDPSLSGLGVVGACTR